MERLAMNEVEETKERYVDVVKEKKKKKTGGGGVKLTKQWKKRKEKESIGSIGGVYEGRRG